MQFSSPGTEQSCSLSAAKMHPCILWQLCLYAYSYYHRTSDSLRLLISRDSELRGSPSNPGLDKIVCICSNILQSHVDES